MFKRIILKCLLFGACFKNIEVKAMDVPSGTSGFSNLWTFERDVFPFSCTDWKLTIDFKKLYDWPSAAKLHPYIFLGVAVSAYWLYDWYVEKIGKNYARKNGPKSGLKEQFKLFQQWIFHRDKKPTSQPIVLLNTDSDSKNLD